MNSARLQATLIAVLGANLAVYAAAGRLSELLDAAAWFVLLAAFSLEAFAPAFTQRHLLALQWVRAVAMVVVLWAAMHYLAEREWLDALNAWLWIMVVLMLEIELRTSRFRPLLRQLCVMLYTGLILVAGAWLAAGEWFDAYDALLWICAFVVVEQGLGPRSRPV